MYDYEFSGSIVGVALREMYLMLIGSPLKMTFLKSTHLYFLNFSLENMVVFTKKIPCYFPRNCKISCSLLLCSSKYRKLKVYFFFLKSRSSELKPTRLSVMVNLFSKLMRMYVEEISYTKV